MSINIVCRFCLKLVRDTDVELVNEVTQKILGTLLIKLDLEVSEDPMICKMCSGILDEIYMFKSKCLYSEDIVSTHFESNFKVNLRDILIELENKPSLRIAEDEVVCRLCIKISPSGNFITLNNTRDKVSYCRNLIDNQLPEIDLSVTEEPTICKTCHAFLENYSSFATSCMDVEQKIKTYCDHRGSNVKEKVDLLCVLQFTENKANDCENIFNGNSVIKEENSSLHVKAEKFVMDNLTEDHFTDGGSTEFYVKEEEVEIKSEDDEIRVEMRESDQLDDCGGIEKTGSPKKKRIRENESKAKIHFCTKCPYSSKDKSTIKRHSEVHGKIWKCNLCPFAVDNRFALRIHMRSHKGPTNMFFCTECTYESRSCAWLVRHLLTHKDKSEVKLHKCPLCAYESKSRKTLRDHQKLQHGENIKIYQCKKCPSSTKYKSNHVKHQLLHKMYESNKGCFSCDQCTYSTCLQMYLRQHKRVNHTGCTTDMVQSDFHTKWKSLNFHKEPYQPTILKKATRIKVKCEQCEYSTYYRSRLNKHLVTHMQLGETEVYYCEACGFKSKYKRSLKNHMMSCLKKKYTVSKGKFKCNRCDFSAKRKGTLIMHKKTHDPTKHKFKCEQCKFWSYHRSKLNQHLVTHMELGDTVVYYCATCEFKSKHKASLTRHVSKNRCPKKQEKDDDKN